MQQFTHWGSRFIVYGKIYVMKLQMLNSFPACRTYVPNDLENVPSLLIFIDVHCLILKILVLWHHCGLTQQCWSFWWGLHFFSVYLSLSPTCYFVNFFCQAFCQSLILCAVGSFLDCCFEYVYYKIYLFSSMGFTFFLFHVFPLSVVIANNFIFLLFPAGSWISTFC